MRTGEDYGKRLNERWRNLRDGALVHLSQTYSSHGFVIDQIEASVLFERVRATNDAEMELVESLGALARYQQNELQFGKLNGMQADNDEGTENADEADEGGGAGAGAPADGENPGAAVAG